MALSEERKELFELFTKTVLALRDIVQSAEKMCKIVLKAEEKLIDESNDANRKHTS